jgi:hypothetical protein
VLAPGEIPRLKLLQPREALLKLIANSYVARFGKQLLQGAHAALHLRQCLKVASQVPIYYLERPNSLALLPVTAQLVEEQFGLTPEAVSQAFSR